MLKKLQFIIKKEMSFLKINDPTKRDLIVKEYLELKKNIRDNLLSERTGELELQTDLSKFYRPITETQKATAREITEGLQPIKEGIEKLLQAIRKEEEEEYEEEEKEEELETEGQIARVYLNRPDYDKTFGIRKEKGHHYIGDTHVIIHRDNIIVDDEKFRGTPGLWELITAKKPKGNLDDDIENYKIILLKINVLHRNNYPNNPYPKASDSYKWEKILSPIWKESKPGKKGSGFVVIPSDPNALLERLDLLLSIKKRDTQELETSW